MSIKTFSVMAAACLIAPVCVRSAASSVASYVDVRTGWDINSSAHFPEKGDALSPPGFAPRRGTGTKRPCLPL